jgi:hypothetical protein
MRICSGMWGMEIPFARDNSTTIRNQGYDRLHIDAIPLGYLVGTDGCGPCIGLIIVGPCNDVGRRTAWVYHFAATHDPLHTLTRDGGMYGQRFPRGSAAVVFGGNNDDQWSMGTLSRVHMYLEAARIRGNLRILGVYNSPGLWVDGARLFYTFGPEHDLRYLDGTNPPPPDRQDGL